MTSRQSRFFIHSCRLSSRSAILVLVWDALMYSYIVLMRYFEGTISSNVQQSETPNSIANIVFNNGYCMLYFIFALVGLIADVWTGRYKIIVTGILLCFFCWIICGVNFIITAYWQNNSLFYVIYAFVYLCAAIGYTGF